METEAPTTHIEPMWVLSTAHIPLHESQALPDIETSRSDLPFPARVIPHSYGWLVHVRTDDFDEVVSGLNTTFPALLTVMLHVHEAGGVWLNLDQDGAVLEQLPTYTW